ncbi:protein GRAVITROPIC IN THE LIGHT 1-like [Andrographis paniculata]|uniref:protein GRAVITROPIC IN THE LIGHT 1-like n=1 Tax=Andrographis paniculata TaxID=175694 RepID=UPI0021E9ABD2|nr:protein GRAVITROPIC IN THE LIGHT 1-like [Andrographis paniculata]
MYRFREMVEVDGGGPSGKQPQQISDMFQKFALAFKAKTYELFAEESGGADSEGDVALLLDSAEEFIPDQKVVVVKPDESGGGSVGELIPSLFATVSSFEAAYLQFQSAHVPAVDREALEQADDSIVSILQKLTAMKNSFKDYSRKRKLGLAHAFPAASIWEFQVEENQSKLRVLETVVNSLQSEIDAKDDVVRDLRKKLDQIRVSVADFTKKLGVTPKSSQIKPSLTIRVFESFLNDSIKSIRSFTKLLIELMNNAGWNLEEAANSVHPGVSYAKTGHLRYTFMSYICLRMCQDFDKQSFGLPATETSGASDQLRQLIEHAESDHMEILRKNPNCEFSRFREYKYNQIIHPTMESSIFSNLSHTNKEKVLDSWKSLSIFYESFTSMASSVWLLHKLANSFTPSIEIFQETVTRRGESGSQSCRDSK